VPKAVLHLGSNKGLRSKNIQLAKMLLEASAGKTHKASAFYETEAWGKKDQRDFLNMAMLMETSHSPDELLDIIHKVENKIGRNRIEKWAARVIDIDILFYNSDIIKNDHLKIPHPEITNRKFVLVPLKEILPDFRHPETGKTVSQMLEDCNDSSWVNLYQS
jgi:2-amino-4-hydroxy-6-hydroxymethyldihydropteridine diphosphokinase